MTIADEDPAMLLDDEEATKEPEEDPMNIGDDDIPKLNEGDPPLLPSMLKKDERKGLQALEISNTYQQQKLQPQRRLLTKTSFLYF